MRPIEGDTRRNLGRISKERMRIIQEQGRRHREALKVSKLRKEQRRALKAGEK